MYTPFSGKKIRAYAVCHKNSVNFLVISLEALAATESNKMFSGRRQRQGEIVFQRFRD
jgi:hypothetical protein